MMCGMTDMQMEILLNLIADKFETCENMADVREKIEELRSMAKKNKA